MSSENTSSPTELHEEFRTIKRQMAEMQVQQNRQQNRRQSSIDESSDSESEQRRRMRRERRNEEDNQRERRNEEDNQRERRRDDRVEGVQIKVPTFMGMNNPEAYMEWEMKIEQVFDCHNYSEEKKEYVMVWWDQLQKIGDGDSPKSINLDELMGLGGPMTRAKAKKSRNTLGQPMLHIQTSIGPSVDTKPINCLMLEEATPLEGHGQEGKA
ncbi:hypothetical protein Lal_00046517 [Lupinus albus]|nr:hypothetical protein Lal_00046517 [Lupinus albus]